MTQPYTTKNETTALLNRHLPIVHLHPDEEFFPSTPYRYLTGSDLFDATTDEPVLIGPLNSTDLYTFSQQHANDQKARPRHQQQIAQSAVTGSTQSTQSTQFTQSTQSTQSFYLRLRPSTADCIRIGVKSDLKHIPVFGRVVRRDETSAVLLYILFFAHRGPSTVLGFKKRSAAHDADFEYAIVHVSGDSLPEDSHVRRVFFSRNGLSSGKWKNASQCELERGIRPHVYVAEDSHGLHSTDAVIVRSFLLESERTSRKGRIWFPRLQVLPFTDDAQFKPELTGWAEVGSSILWDRDAKIQLNSYYDYQGAGIGWQIALSPFEYGFLSFGAEVGVAVYLARRTDFITDQYGLVPGTILSLFISYVLLWLSQNAVRFFSQFFADKRSRPRYRPKPPAPIVFESAYDTNMDEENAEE
jgi:hypothetical protein